MKHATNPDRARVLVGDCRELMRGMPDESVDAIVTDPPYELGFMAKRWDASGIAYDVGMWREALRVLKPGGHLLAFGGTRTYHRMTCAIEDAGFEVRDSIHWIYGSGFPKSLDVTKAIDKIDKLGPMEARARVFTAWMRSTGVTAQQINEVTGSFMGSHYLTDKSQPAVATSDLFDKLRPILPSVPTEIEDLVQSRTAEIENMKRRKVIGTRKDVATRIYDNGEGEPLPKEIPVTVPATDAARQWNGWGTALKPAHEPIVVARKPLGGTVAANVLEHGTGAINVDGCRVGGDGGRWPANILLTHSPECGDECAEDCAVVEMDRQSGNRPGMSGGGSGRRDCSMFNIGGVTKPSTIRGDFGGASRFFPIFRYQAKASRRERGEGNNHPTVKPVELMRWLVRLVTQPGGTVLDPFTGSGTTGVASVLEGFQFVGCEQSEDYANIARARIEAAAGNQLTIDVVK